MSPAPHPTCAQCGAPADAVQRYCLSCGARVGERSPQLEALLQNQRSARAVADSGSPPTPPRAAAVARRSGLALPAPRVSAVLVLAFLGFGVLLGGAASPQAGTLASSRAPVKVLLGPSTDSAAASPGSAAPPAASEEATPSSGEASEASSAPVSSPAPAAPKASSGKKTSGSQGSEGEASGSSSTGSSSTGSPAAGAPTKAPPVKHVFVIMLAEQPYASVFGPASSAPYLAQTLEQRGELLVRFYGVAHEGLPDGIALLSGQGPTVETAADCPHYTSVEPGTVGADQQASGSGCVYPQGTQTLAGQLAAKHLSWRAYVEGMDEPGAPAGACAHPALGQSDPTSTGPPNGRAYITSRNPFVYFHSIIDSPACAADDVGLKQLASDLAGGSRTPSFSYIVPGPCHDASSTPCRPGAPAGPAAADSFLQKVVPEITGSQAYKQGGLLVITVDQAPVSGPFGDSSSCCGQPQFPNLPAPSTTIKGLPSKGGGQVGALLLSPYIKGGSVDQEPFNDFSLLRTIEDMFGVGHLGYAGLAGVSSFGPSMYTAYKGG